MGSCFWTGTADWEQASEHVDWEILVGDLGLGLELLDVEGKFGSSSKQSSGSLSGHCRMNKCLFSLQEDYLSLGNVDAFSSCDWISW